MRDIHFQWFVETVFPGEKQLVIDGCNNDQLFFFWFNNDRSHWVNSNQSHRSVVSQWHSLNSYKTHTFLYNPWDNHGEGTISQSLPHLLSYLCNNYNETQQPVGFSWTYKPFPKTKILCNSRMMLWHIQPDSNASLTAKSYYLTVYNDMKCHSFTLDAFRTLSKKAQIIIWHMSK